MRWEIQWGINRLQWSVGLLMAVIGAALLAAPDQSRSVLDVALRASSTYLGAALLGIGVIALVATRPARVPTACRSGAVLPRSTPDSPRVEDAAPPSVLSEM